MAVTDEEEERAVCLVLADVKATLGPGYESMVRDIAGRLEPGTIISVGDEEQ